MTANSNLNVGQIGNGQMYADHVEEYTAGHGISINSPIYGYGVNPLGSIIAIGNIAAWALPAADQVKDGYALCNGNTFAALGAGNYNAAFLGSSRPTLNDSRFLMGSTAPSAGGAGIAQGANSFKLIATDIPQISTFYTPAGTNAASSVSGTAVQGATDATGGNHTHTVSDLVHNRQIYMDQLGGTITQTVPYRIAAEVANPLVARAAGGHSHSLSGTAAAQGFSGTQATITVGTAVGSQTLVENRPLYFSVVYLMRVK
jgi:hypothetical protein